MEKRIGRVLPTKSVIIPYQESKGAEAIEIYESSGRNARKWQQQQIEDIMGTDEDSLWVHSKYGYSVPRRNGKSEIALIRCLWGLSNNERILYTAHRTTTSHAQYIKICKFLEDMGYEKIARLKKDQKIGEKQYHPTAQLGLETIETEHGFINFRTRSSQGGLGEGYDLLVIDEAQEYTVDQMSALQYTVTDSENPQTLFLGTPPTAVSAGTVFLKMRDQALMGESKYTGWAEWSLDEMTSDFDNEDLLYETNPSLGCGLSLRSIDAEDRSDKIDYNIQRYGVWLHYNQKSVISETEWKNLQCETLPNFTGQLFVGIKFGSDGVNTSMSIAVRTDDDRIFIETIDCVNTTNGNAWIINFLRKADVSKVLIDGKNGQEMLKMDARSAHVKTRIDIATTGQVITASQIFMNGFTQKEIVHNGQPSLQQAVSNCDKRPIGSGGGYGFKANKEGIDISIMESAVLAFYLCKTTDKVRKKQKMYV